MSFVVLTSRERDELVQLFFSLKKKSEKYPDARIEALTALRCLKAVHSNAIEDKNVDRIFLQLMLHQDGIEDKSLISEHYADAAKELRGQEFMLKWLEKQAIESNKYSIGMVVDMHRYIFEKSSPFTAGKFRVADVKIKGMAHRPPNYRKIKETLLQHLENINYRLFSIEKVTPDSFFEILALSAEVHYVIAAIHPFQDGNGRVARAAGDYAMLVHGLYYDVIMTDYRDIYLDSIESCSIDDTKPLYHFIEYSYLETLKRISGLFDLIK